VISKKRKRTSDTPEVCDDDEDVDVGLVYMDPFGGSAPVEEDAFEFNITESTTPIPTFNLESIPHPAAARNPITVSK